ncbi:MAG: hypothetical protein EBY39_02905 [Flavobacteriia bacterium]|nr:hypothetical protein [Flavobacteriia bacterium]
MYNIAQKTRKVKNFFTFFLAQKSRADFMPTLEIVLGMVAVVDILGLLKVEKGDPVLQIADFVADRNSVSNRKHAVLKGFVKDRDFFKHF